MLSTPAPTAHSRDERSKRRFAGRFALSGALLALTLSVFGVGVNATFTSTAVDSHQVVSGTVQIALGADGPANRFSVDATNIAAGDTIERAFDLTNTGSLDLSAVQLARTATVSSQLDTDATNGLQLRVDRCTVPWTESGTAPGYTYTCDGGTESNVLASGAVIGSGDLSGLASLTAGGTDHLRLFLTLPVDADNSFQGLSSTVEYEFTATQRAATSR